MRAKLMFKAIILISISFLSLTTNGHALNSISKFIVNHGVSDCNGESPDCRDFYTRAVELNDDKTPISPEIRF
jgi:hypothetical protein